MKKIISIGLLIGVALTGKQIHAQEQSCKDELIAYVEAISEVPQPKGKQAYYIHYTIKTDFAPETNQPSAESYVKVERTENKVYYETDKFAMYTDDKEAIAVLPHRRQIIRENSALNPIENEQFDKLATFEDSLFKTATVLSCKTLEGDKIKVSLRPSSSVQKRFKIERMEVIYDRKEKRITQVSNYFNDQSKIRKQTAIYHTIDYNYKGKIADKAYDKIFTSSGKLRPAYANYRVSDEREKH